MVCPVAEQVAEVMLVVGCKDLTAVEIVLPELLEQQQLLTQDQVVVVGQVELLAQQLMQVAMVVQESFV
jgi:hypothetical protein